MRGGPPASTGGGPLGPLKIVVLGEGRVGKTSLLRRYVRQSFDERESSTQSAAYLEKRLAVNGKQVHLSLWDTAGQERFHSLAPIYYRDAVGALLVYDVTDEESFRRVAKWVEELRAVGTRCALTLVGNKTDLRSMARVSADHAEAYARSIGAAHCYASAKLGQGVNEAFALLVETVLLELENARRRSSGGGGGLGGRRSNGTGILVADAAASPGARRRGCCGGDA
eukprot:TRINITY_DN39341_c0_g1_i1.p1 TRINITY_DN39341_c0_g1~~TRINITY_DN39341_c0_g1_i1.p1  ORF type:complete len:226 (-),score=40.51 TRINITY_DN39341_c0_g1_i1:127-804(-)